MQTWQQKASCFPDFNMMFFLDTFVDNFCTMIQTLVANKYIFPSLPFFFYSPLPVDFRTRLPPLAGSSQFCLFYCSPLITEAETCCWAASSRRPPSPGGPAALSCSGCTSCRATGSPAPPWSFVRWSAGRVSVQATEGWEDFCQRPTDFRRWYVGVTSQQNTKYIPLITEFNQQIYNETNNHDLWRNDGCPLYSK